MAAGQITRRSFTSTLLRHRAALQHTLPAGEVCGEKCRLENPRSISHHHALGSAVLNPRRVPFLPNCVEDNYEIV